jgi:hypothetical protein
MVVLMEVSLISTEELWSSDSDHWFLVHLPKALLPRLFSLAKQPAFGRSKLLPVKNNGGHCVLGTFNVAEMFWYPSSDLCLDTILSALTCIVNCGTLYRQVCAFPNHVQSIEFTTGGLQVLETSPGCSMETGCT